MLAGFCLILIAVFAAVAITNPFKGLLCLFLVKPTVEMSWDSYFGPVNSIDILYTLAPFLLLPHVLSRVTSSVNFSRWTMVGLALAIANSIGILSGFQFSDPIPTLETLIKAVNVFAAFILIPAFVDDEKKLKYLLLAILIGNLIPCGIGIYQAMTGVTWSSRFTVGLARFNGFYHDAVGVRFNGQQAIFAAMMLASMFPIQKLIYKLLLFAYSIVWIGVIFNVYSKAAVVTLLVWFAIWCFAQRNIALLIIMFSLAVGADQLSSNSYSDSILQLFSKEIAISTGELSEERYALAGRLFIWERSMADWNRATPTEKIFGTGKNFPVHNEFLRIMIYSGYLGGVIFTLVMLYAAFKFLVPIVSRFNRIQVGAAMAYSMMLIDSMGLHPCLYGGHQWFVWGFMGLAIVGSPALIAKGETRNRLRETGSRPSKPNEVTGVEAP